MCRTVALVAGGGHTFRKRSKHRHDVQHHQRNQRERKTRYQAADPEGDEVCRGGGREIRRWVTPRRTGLRAPEAAPPALRSTWPPRYLSAIVKAPWVVSGRDGARFRCGRREHDRALESWPGGLH